MFALRARRLAAGPIGLALLALVTISGPPPATAQATASMVVIKNFDFSPMTVTIAAGGTVTWKNLDDEPHTVTSADGLFRSGALDEGDTFKFKFDKPGTYKYVCSVHPKMRAMIVVK